MRGTCPTCWRSHGCYLAAGHEGEHVCDPCPPDCGAPVDEDWAAGYMADQCGSCSVHCGDRPAEGMRERLAKSLLPLMNDAPQEAFDPPLPACISAAHEWSIVHDKVITEQSRWGAMTVTYPIAIVCDNCGAALSIAP